MRILELKLIRYGRFTDTSLDFPTRDRDIHLIVGPNEAGKSTVRSAIGDWLFGIPARTLMGFRHPMSELSLGGVIERLESGEREAKQFAFVRTKGNRNTLRNPFGAVLPDVDLHDWLGNLTLDSFIKMIAIDHTTLVAGGVGVLSASNDIGKLLFQSASGIEQIGDALTGLQKEADALWGPRKASDRAYYQALSLYQQANSASKEATLRTKDWKDQSASLAAGLEELAAAQAHITQVQQKLSRLERIRRVRPLINKLNQCIAKQHTLFADKNVASLEPTASEVLSSAAQDKTVADADRQRVVLEIAEIEAELTNTPVNQLILAQLQEIQELNESRLQYRAHRTDMVKREEEIRLDWVRLQDQARGLGWAAESEDDVRQRLPAASVRGFLGKLIQQKSVLARDLKSAKAGLTEVNQRIKQAKDELSGLVVDDVDSALTSLVERATNLGDYDAAIRELQDEIDILVKNIDTGMKALGTWRCPLEVLQAMVVPPTAHIQNLIDQHRSNTTEETNLRQAITLAKQEVERLGLELQQFVRKFQPISREQVEEARYVRDDAWRAIKSNPESLPDKSDGFEELLSDADVLADGRHDRAQHEADHQSKSDALEHKTGELRQLENRLSEVVDRKLRRAADWKTLASISGLPALPFDVVPSWLQERARILEWESIRSTRERRRAEWHEIATELSEKLREKLGQSSGSSTVPTLSVCLVDARLRISQAEQAQGQRRSLEQQIRTDMGSLSSLEAAVESAQSNWNSWTVDWELELQSAGYRPSTPADRIEADLTVLEDIDRLLNRIRSIRTERIETMQADLDALAARADALAQQLAPELLGQRAEDIIVELVTQLSQANTAATRTVELQASLRRKKAEQEQADNKLLDVEARLAPLMALANVDNLADLGKAIERSNERRTLDTNRAEIEGELEAASDGLPLTQLQLECESIGVDERLTEHDRLSAESAKEVERIGQLGTNIGERRKAFEALDGSDQATRAEAQRQEAIAAMVESAERYLKVQTAARLLKWSLEKFRETNQGPMLAKASANFNILTLGSFGRLVADSDGGASPRLVGIRDDGEQVPVTGMSEGSRDQLYLALRLAALEIQVEQGYRMPLIADDLFINFDDERTAAGLTVLGELSRQTQIIFLTHHDHLVPLAQKVLGDDLNVIHL